MSFSLIIVVFFVLFFALLATFWPLWVAQTKQSYRNSIDELDILLQEREMILINLKDLQSDLAHEKLGAEEYELLKTQLLERASKVYEAIQNLEEKDPLILQMESDSRV